MVFTRITFLISLLLISLYSPVTRAVDQLQYFDIPAKRADKAIVSFAQQANISVVFSYELTKNYQSTAIKGYFTHIHALRKLLRYSGLSSEYDESNQIRIIKTPVALKKSTKLEKEVLPQVQKNKTASVEQISVIGSRTNGRTYQELAVPVDVFSAQDIKNTGQKSLGKVLQVLAPSFNFSSSSISDGSDVLQPATLRGLGPDQTLVLINGKRRHQASLIHINNSVGRGTAGVDMNAISLISIKKIEVLRDGAAAQYGSDAIAGVINIVLHDKPMPLTVGLSYGQYSKGDGESTNIDISNGINFSDKALLNISMNLTEQGSTDRSGLHGSCQFYGCSPLGNDRYLAGDKREHTITRDTFDIGDPYFQQIASTLNGKIYTQDGFLYGFATYSRRTNESAAFFRHHANKGANPLLLDNEPAIPNGYLPMIESKIKDHSVNIGYEQTFENDAVIDMSYTYGKNKIDYWTKSSVNASYANYLHNKSNKVPSDIRLSLPSRAYAYGLSLSLQTFNLTYKTAVNDISIALGTEYRKDHYKVLPGEEYAYKDYDTIAGQPLFNNDAYGSIQGFPGISPESKVNESRDIYSAFADIETDINESWFINSAVRHEHSADFGNNTSVKVASKWQQSPQLSYRAALSTGYRAPSMQQLYFNNTSTQFIVDDAGELVAENVTTFRNDSLVARHIGIKELQEERSVSLSVGMMYTPITSMNIEMDIYAIDIDDRIVISNKLDRSLALPLSNALAARNTSKGQFFLNGADTETRGIDLVATYKKKWLNGTLDFTFAGNYTDTDVVALYTPVKGALTTIHENNVFSDTDISIIEEWQPNSHLSLNTLYQSSHFSLNVMVSRYGEYTILDGERQTYDPEWLTDINLTYKLSKSVEIYIGGNNIFGTTPDRNKIGNSRNGTIEDDNGNIIVESEGVFKYSRRSAPFGFNGAYFYAGLNYQL